MKEFAAIEHYFRQGFVSRPDVVLGVGDDAALVSVPPEQELVISVDTLVEGVHFPKQTTAYDIGYKALAVNLSDMAAMGATPAWFTLALSCPEMSASWLQQFSQGLRDLAVQHQVSLIGGDTTCSQAGITISIQIMGLVPRSRALRRDKAKVGDAIFVTGTLGNAGLGLASVFGQVTLPEADKHPLEQSLNRPTPRVAMGQQLRELGIHCAIDVSDGLLADLGHILTASAVGARLNLTDLPLSDSLKNNVSLEQGWHLALSSGDDYELCCTVAVDKMALVQRTLPNLHHIGYIESQQGLRCIQPNGERWQPKAAGYEHFSATDSIHVK